MIQEPNQTYVLPAQLPLDEGGLLPKVKVAYEQYGEPAEGRCVLLLHDLTSSHRALGPTEAGAFQPSGWASALVGPGKAIDPAHTCVLSLNLLGSPYGSTSPVSVDPRTGNPFAGDFPALTVEDMARAVAATVRGLGHRRLRAMIGVGFGAMVGLRCAALFPDLAAGVVSLGGPRSLSEGLRKQFGLVAHRLLQDPAYRQGAYPAEDGPVKTLRKLRLELLQRMTPRQHLSATFPDMLAADRFLEAEAEAFARSFDANCYARLCGAYASCDLGAALEKATFRALLVSCSSDEIAPPSRVRDTYHLLSAAGARASYYELQSDLGHAGLAQEAERLRGPLHEFLSSVS